MKSTRKNMCVIFCTLLLLLLALLAETEEEAVSPYFRIQSDSGVQNITLFDAEDGNYYVFLPSYADLEEVSVILPPEQKFFLGENRLYNKMTCESFELEKPYDFITDGYQLGTLWFYQSRNVATMYIDTASGEMTDIHKDKNYEEYASMTIYLPDGDVGYYDVSSRLKGRGNATWWGCDKRPYSLTLSADGDLLGMGAGRKWALLANAYDETNLNNKLVYDLASQVGFDWSPDSRFVDLYLNGEYNGLYLLTEKIAVQENRLNIDESSGDFLCTIDLWERKDLLERPFESSMGRLVEVCYPEFLSDSDFDYVTYLVYLMENELRSGADLSQSELLDLDSWVRRYLIDEISGNIDSDLTSSYFYYSDGKFFAGPIWDYDMAFGNNLRNQEPCAFIAKNANKTAYFPSPYYSTLYTNESFYQRLTEIYRTEFSPVLQKMISRDIDVLTTAIQEASQMNSVRWHYMYDELLSRTVGIVQSPADLKSHFTKRMRFLDQVWLENKDFCTVQFEPKPGNPYWNISVEKGTCLETSYMDLEHTVWIDTQTGMPVDFQNPITQDLILSIQIPSETQAVVPQEHPAEGETVISEEPAVQEEAVLQNDPDSTDYKTFSWAGVFLVLFLIVLLTDLFRRKKRKRNADVAEELKISK